MSHPLKKRNNNLTFALTGATGFLGSNLLLEIIKENKNHLDEINIITFGRSSKSSSLKKRINNILKENIADYLSVTHLSAEELINTLENSIQCINLNFEEKDLGITHDEYKILLSTEIDFLYHTAASTDLRQDKFVAEELEKTNVEGTQAILNLVSKLKVKEFISFINF